MRTRTIVLILFGAFVFSRLMHHYFVPPRETASLSEEMSTPAPAFSWQEADGSLHPLSELSGKPVVIHFWAAWCGNCQEEFPQLLKAAAAHKDIVFLLIASDQQEEDSLRFLRRIKALDKRPPNVIYAFDPDKAITYDLFQTVYYPETILLDAHHNMRWKAAATLDWQGDALGKRFADLRTP